MAKEKDSALKKVKRPTAQKRDIQNEKKRLLNQRHQSRIRTAIRSFEEALKASDNSAILESLNEVYSTLDKGVKRGILKLNKGSRTKSRLSLKAKTKIGQAA